MIKADNTQKQCFIACSEEYKKNGRCSCLSKGIPALQSLQSCVSVSVTESELQVGNYIMDIDSKRIGFIKAIKAKLYVKMEFSTLIQKAEYFKNVEITEDWLLKLKFTSNPYQDIYYLSDFVLDIDKTKGVLEIYYRDIKIEFVHQLQNLYFLITGLELQIGNLTEH